MRAAGWILSLLIIATLAGRALAATPYAGQVVFGGLPVPGASVTASQGDKRFVATTDGQGVYRFADLADGVWSIRIEMLGFQTLTQDVTVGAGAMPIVSELTLRPFEDIAKDIQPKPAAASAPQSTAAPSTPGTAAGVPKPATPQSGFQRAGVTAAPNADNQANRGNAGNGTPANAAAAPNAAPAANPDSAADGLLVNGSVNNGAASPFAQLAAFGNNRRGARSLYNWGFGAILGNSAWDASPYSFSPRPVAKPTYDDVQLIGTFGGPLKIGGTTQNRPNLFVGYQRTSEHNARTQSALMPTLLERNGNFSQSLDPLGRPIQIIDPITGQPFPNNTIPSDRISPQAASLLGYYPVATNAGGANVNYQAPVLVGNQQDSVQTRITQSLSGKTQIFGNISYQRTSTDTTTLFGFEDAVRASNLAVQANWAHRYSPFFSLRLRYQFDRVASDTTPFFAFRTNVSGDAGISGNNQDPVNWGPPALQFTSGIAGLSDAVPNSTRSITNTVAGEGIWTHNRHTVTMGLGIHRRHVDVNAQQDPRGTFSFSGALTGSDFADFLLGVPHASSIAFGNADKNFRGNSYEAYVSDDWRVNSGLTINAGLRWEYEAPFTEQLGRLTNLDVATGFSAISPVLATDPQGALTGEQYPASLLRPDRRGIQPRVGVAWRPIAGSSLVIRAGYGVYRNTSVYQPIDLLLAQQPPLSKALSVENSAETPLTLANGFVAPASATTNTFAVDPDFRVGFSQTWQVSMQRDLPGSMTVLTTYSGAKGSRLLQEFLPNTYPIGAANPCPSCPAGFVYLTSTGNSLRNAAQLELRRRLRNGLTATVQYTLARSTDNAGAFTGVNLAGQAIAQDWLSLDADQGPSNFDQRHLMSFQVQYTTGIGVAGGALLTGKTGALVKGWTLTGLMTTGSGLPVTPVYLVPVPGTGFTGSVRGSTTGVPVDPVSSNSYVNPAAFSTPAAGQWGTAGRNSIRGPAQFNLNAGVTRTFPVGERMNLDWRLDATNVLNRVTFTSIGNVVGGSQFGLPTEANVMRRITTTIRLRY